MSTAIEGLQRQMRPSFARSDAVLAMKKVVPRMEEGGFIIYTTFGDVSFHDADAEVIARFVRALLEAKARGATGAYSEDGRSIEPKPGERSRNT